MPNQAFEPQPRLSPSPLTSTKGPAPLGPSPPLAGVRTSLDDPSLALFAAPTNPPTLSPLIASHLNGLEQPQYHSKSTDIYEDQLADVSTQPLQNVPADPQLHPQPLDSPPYLPAPSPPLSDRPQSVAVDLEDDDEHLYDPPDERYDSSLDSLFYPTPEASPSPPTLSPAPNGHVSDHGSTYCAQPHVSIPLEPLAQDALPTPHTCAAHSHVTCNAYVLSPSAPTSCEGHPRTLADVINDVHGVCEGPHAAIHPYQSLASSLTLSDASLDSRHRQLTSRLPTPPRMATEANACNEHVVRVARMLQEYAPI